MKRTMLGILVGITVITIIFVVLGYKYDKSDVEKQQGKSGVYDVAADGTIAYVSFASGIAGLFISSDDRLPVVELPVDQTILDLSYSKDGTTLAYVVAAKDFQEQSGSTVHLLNTETREEKKTFSTKGLITDLAFDPADPNRLFYLQADSFTNYSPIASKAPHDYDVHSYHFANGTTKKHTDMKAYAMDSLQVAEDGESVYLRMDDEQEVETAEDVFESKQRIFNIPLAKPERMEIISNPQSDQDIYDFLLLPKKKEIIYQAVGGTGKNGIFEYELFVYHTENGSIEQLTALKEHAASPKRGPDGKIYFLVDRNFGHGDPDYYLYQMSEDGTDITEVPW